MKTKIPSVKQREKKSILSDMLKRSKNKIHTKILPIQNSSWNHRYLISMASRAVIFSYVFTVAETMRKCGCNFHTTSGTFLILFVQQFLTTTKHFNMINIVQVKETLEQKKNSTKLTRVADAL